MKKIFLVTWLLPSYSLANNVDAQLKNIIGKHTVELSKVIGSTMASCVEKIATNEADLALANEELSKIGAGIAQVIAEKALTLALKKDYPNACHVLSQNALSQIENGEDSDSVCINWIGKKCIQRETRRYPTYSYYWPKYFIEVSNKGNDPFPAFASSNSLYAANRKIANMVSSFVDLQGPYTLLAKVVGTSSVLSSLKSTTNVDMKPASGELAQALKTAVLIPFERLRIRANDSPDMPSFEANIWPVGMSQSIAEHLSVCQKGGFEWKLPGVPMTCPIAMARDAWSLWDTGLLDYLNPNAIRGMATSSTLASCLGEQAASLMMEDPKDWTSSLGEKDNVTSLISNLPTSFRGMGMCSFPILGSTEALISQSSKLLESFKGPWCTLWGPLTPRASTHIYKTDYAYANAALKFKLLAHDVFGIPRGKAERWTLVYPWEGGSTDSANQESSNVLAFLKEQGLSNLDLIKSSSDAASKARSNMLMIPGDIALIDTSYDAGVLAEEAKNLAKELAYLASLAATSSLSEQAALAAFKKENAIVVSSSSEVIKKQAQELRSVTDETARLGAEPVFEKNHTVIFGGRGRDKAQNTIKPLLFQL